MTRVSRRQANAEFARTVDQLQPALDGMKQAVSEIAERLAADTGEDPAVTDRLTQAGYAYANSAFELDVAIAEACLKLDATHGDQRRFEQERAALNIEAQAYQEVAEAWKQRVIERGLTVPEVRDDVDIAALADAELRDIYRALRDGRLDEAGARRRIVDVAARFDISDDELVAWHASQGFGAPT